MLINSHLSLEKNELRMSMKLSLKPKDRLRWQTLTKNLKSLLVWGLFLEFVKFSKRWSANNYTKRKFVEKYWSIVLAILPLFLLKKNTVFRNQPSLLCWKTKFKFSENTFSVSEIKFVEIPPKPQFQNVTSLHSCQIFAFYIFLHHMCQIPCMFWWFLFD